MDLFLPTKTDSIDARLDELKSKEYKDKYNLKILKDFYDGVDKTKRENNKITRVYRGGVEGIKGYKRDPDIYEVLADLKTDNGRTIWFSYELPVEE